MRRILVVLVGLAISNVGLGQSTEPDENNAAARKARLELMTKMMDQTSIFVGEDRKEVMRIKTPLMRHNDASRNYKDGTLWAFGEQGRPKVMMILQPDSSVTDRWWHSATSLCEQPVEGKVSGRQVWATEEAGLQFEDLKDAAPPKKSRVLRLAQMRKIASRFKAHQFWEPDNQRFQLRLLRQPVHRYEDPKAGIIDGAILGFMVNVHPELLLVLEATGDDRASKWRYAFVKIGSAEFHGLLDGKEVYKSDRAIGVLGRPSDSYRMFASYASNFR